MRTLRVEIKPKVVEINLDDYYDEDTDLDSEFDSLYDGFIHEIVTQPDYTYEIIDTDE